MAFSDAEQIVRLAGAGAFLCIGGNDRTLAQELRQRGALVDGANALDELAQWDPASGPGYDCVIVEASAMLEKGTLESSFRDAHRLGARWLVLRCAEHRDLILRSHEVGTSAAWEKAALAAHFRRAPQAVSLQRYLGEWQQEGVPLLLDFERIADAASAPHAADMSRVSGALADAHMVRYALAASLVRQGDTVLDCACGAGYGSAILAAQSAGARYIGVDADPAAIGYAQASFGPHYGVEFVAASPAGLAFLEDDSVDLVVSFGTIGQLDDDSAFIREALRVLKPDGRIVASVRQREGGDDLDGLRGLLGASFLLEERWVQNGPGMARRLDKLALGAAAVEGEWMIVVASVDPLAKATLQAYTDPEFAGVPAQAGCWVADFGGHYHNPWLYRSMVHMGDRVRDRDTLTDLAARALDAVPMDSADFGAALTVLGYALLPHPESGHVDDLLPLIDAYLGRDLDNPHAKRWQISSAYLAGKLALGRGERDLAAMYFGAVEKADFMEFSPLLATKAIAASFQLGVMALAADDHALAATHFSAGVQTSRAALKADDVNAIGDPAAPYPFGFTELAEVADMGAQCAMALKLLPLARRSPGLFWQKVDTRRFGLVSWALDLERENRELRAQLASRL
jgi:SAM-dependent methyltransferase